MMQSAFIKRWVVVLFCVYLSGVLSGVVLNRLCLYDVGNMQTVVGFDEKLDGTEVNESSRNKTMAIRKTLMFFERLERQRTNAKAVDSIRREIDQSADVGYLGMVAFTAQGFMRPQMADTYVVDDFFESVFWRSVSRLFVLRQTDQQAKKVLEDFSHVGFFTDGGNRVMFDELSAQFPLYGSNQGMED